MGSFRLTFGEETGEHRFDGLADGIGRNEARLDDTCRNGVNGGIPS